MTRPCVMIAATGSGRGKTAVTCAILRALTERGLTARAFKAGPDYIDPMFHRAALGIPSKNLDLFFTDAPTVNALFEEGNDADISIVEGVMGLYDGLAPDSDAASSYRLACALDAPVVLVADARGMSRSLIAEIRGFLDYDAEKRIKGVILNNVSEAFYQTVAPIIERELGVAALGSFPNLGELAFESRYLGLKLPGEIDGLRAKLGEAARVAEKTLQIDRLLELARERADFAPPTPAPPVPNPIARVAIAQDAAFCFYYEDNLRMLRAAGLELVPFSPLRNEPVPADASGLILGGGYPELFAAELARADAAKESIRQALNSGLPTLAECGGFMWLHEKIVTREGEEFPAVGALPGACRYAGKLVRFGYVTLQEKTPRFLTGASRSIRGHEFHYYDVDADGADCEAVKPSGKRWPCAHVDAGRWLGFAHLYYPSNPDFVRAFADACAIAKRRVSER